MSMKTFQVTLDRNLLDLPEGLNKTERPAPSPMPPPSVGSTDSSSDKAPSTPKPDPGKKIVPKVASTPWKI